MQKLINITKVSELTGFTVGTLYQFCSRKRIPFYRFSRRCIKFSPDEIMAWIDGHKVEQRGELPPIGQRRK